MGLYYRKSLKLGLLRINFSKGGVSYSTGVKGARINTGSRGTYVTIGSNGIYYKQKIGGIEQRPVQPVIIQNPGVHAITSADIDQLSDVDSKDFINELNEKAAKISFVNWFGILPLVLFVIVLSKWSMGYKETLVQEGGLRNIVIIDSDVGSNIRSQPDGDSKIIASAKYAEEFMLLDSKNKNWYKINYNNAIGYLSKKLSHVSVVDHPKKSLLEIDSANPHYVWELGVGMLFFAILIYFLSKLDRKRFEMELYYEMDDQMDIVYKAFARHFSSFNSSNRKWQYLHRQQNDDWKRNGGAGKLINRVEILAVSTNKAPSRYLKTNVDIPHIRLKNTELFFLPERLLIKRGSQFAAVFYKNLHIQGETTRFIEDEGVPNDAKVVDYTWKYVNRKGGPDKRFNNNRQLPICLYSQYTLKSGTGIYETICTSRIGAFDSFSEYLEQIGFLQKKMCSGVQII